MIFLSQLLRLRNRKDSERGLTLTELLVAMGLLVLVAGVALAILLSTTSNSARFGQNTANQTEVANAINIINRDIAVASSVNYASNTALTLRSQEDSVQYTVKLFGYDPSKEDKGLPLNYTVNTGSLPTFPAIIEQRQADGAATVTQNVLVPGWTTSNQSTPLFSYYDQNDSQLQPENGGNASLKDPASARRIEFFISAKVSDRSSNIELAGSATPNSFSAQGIGCSANCFPPVPIAPVLRGTLAEGERTAHLTWEVSAGATSYTLYRKVNGGAYEVRAIISEPDTKKFDDSQNIDWGNIYSYYLVAFGSGGVSANSNEVPLTVVPDKVNIVNINTKAGLNDIYPNSGRSSGAEANGYTYTVARNLTNQITWQPVNGATGYYIYRDGNSTPIATVGSEVHSIQDSSVDYGQTRGYQVEAFNQGTNCDGVCDGKWSEKTSLISPPTAPGLRIDNAQVRNRDYSPYNNVYLDTLAKSDAIYGYKLYRVGASSSKPTCDVSSMVDTEQELPNYQGSRTTNYVSWNEGDCYRSRAYNDAGLGPWSSDSSPISARAYQSSSEFSFQNVNSTAGLNDSNNGYGYTVARGLTNQLTWNNSYGVNGYEIYRDGQYYAYAGGSNVNSWRDTNLDYGQDHTYFVRAYVSWNEGDDLSVLHDPYLRDRGDSKRKEIDSPQVRLISPPTAPTINAYNLNVQDRNSTPYNRVYVTNRSNGGSISGYHLYRNGLAGEAASCSGLNDTGQDGGGDFNNNVSFGEGDCYGVRGYNDAGFSPMSNTVRTYQGPSSFSFQNVNSRANLGDSANGYAYTVARNNTNQLSWNESYGAEGYEIYRTDGTYIGYLGSGSRSWQENANNGDVRGYFVRAFIDWNDPGGNVRKTIDSDRVTLVSPPTSPQISTTANDDSTASKSTNYVYVNSYGANAANVSIYRAQQAASNPQCNTNNALTDSAGGTNRDDNADWGSSTCYVARAYNDAGSSPLSNTATADQLPGKFGFNSWQNTRNYLATYAEGFVGLNNASNNNNDGVTSSRNQSLAYTLGWGGSLGSKRYNLIYGYKKDNNSARDDWSGNGYSACGGANNGIVNSLMPSNSVDNTNCFREDSDNSTSTSFKTQNLSPGSYYRAVAVAVGNNDTRRGTSTEFATTPTIAKFASTYSYKRQVNNASKGGSDYMARVANVSLSTTFGSATSVRAFYDWNDSATVRGSGVGNPSWYSRDAAQGTSNYLRVRTSGHSATQDSLNKNAGLCKLVSGNFCDVFNTNYDGNGNADTTRGDLTNRYNSNRFSAYNGGTAPPKYQWGNGDTIFATGGTQTYLSAPSYNYSGYSDVIQWEGGISESNCYYLACNPNNNDAAVGPWAGYSYNEYVPKGDTNHAYYFMSGAQGINPDATTQGNPPDAATRSYATGSASTSDGSLPDNNAVGN